MSQQRVGDGIGVRVKTGGKTEEVVAEKVLVAFGRTPNTSGLGLESVGVQLDSSGYVMTGEGGQTGAAGIARGTFYNYFKSTDELLQATSKWLSEELIEEIEGEVRSLTDPAIRFGLGIRLWMRWAQANPSWSLFIARVWNVGHFN